MRWLFISTAKATNCVKRWFVLNFSLFSEGIVPFKQPIGYIYTAYYELVVFKFDAII